MDVALVCIAKDEDHYIQEWIDYHIKLGFDHVFVYANDWKYSTNNKQISVYEYDGTAKQMVAYNDFIQNKSNNYNWAAFFDVDEFLVLKRHANIKQFLSDYNECDAVGINWAIFGANGHENVQNNEYSVLKRFTKRSTIENTINNHVKCILKLPFLCKMSVHNPESNWYNVHKEIRSGPHNKPTDWSIAQLNHYFSKSREELLLKCQRGRADNNEYRVFEQHLPYLDFNDEEDYIARDFLYKKENT